MAGRNLLLLELAVSFGNFKNDFSASNNVPGAIDSFATNPLPPPRELKLSINDIFGSMFENSSPWVGAFVDPN